MSVYQLPSSLGGQKSSWEPLELELWAVLNYLVWVLKTRSSASALKRWAICPAPLQYSFALWSFSGKRSHYIVQAGWELVNFLPLPSECWDCLHALQCSAEASWGLQSNIFQRIRSNQCWSPDSQGYFRNPKRWVITSCLLMDCASQSPYHCGPPFYVECGLGQQIKH